MIIREHDEYYQKKKGNRLNHQGEPDADIGRLPKQAQEPTFRISVRINPHGTKRTTTTTLTVQHRAEVAALLTRYDATLGDLATAGGSQVPFHMPW